MIEYLYVPFVMDAALLSALVLTGLALGYLAGVLGASAVRLFLAVRDPSSR